ncbi:hypothetical protein QYE76_052390 [Lolium multiflorum]|uniref:Uncharacterized protein n=1 Tax=Lolium multiflorum TaxID=4521 RepID=A0AAD8STU4_LOLMU|nr:hypothetical protein QYE76_052390 [Lolium multiflorum]
MGEAGSSGRADALAAAMMEAPTVEEEAPMEEEEEAAEETEVEDDDDDEFDVEKKLQDDARAREEAHIRRAIELSLQAAQQGTAEDARRERHRPTTAAARGARAEELR